MTAGAIAHAQSHVEPMRAINDGTGYAEFHLKFASALPRSSLGLLFAFSFDTVRIHRELYLRGGRARSAKLAPTGI